MIQANELRLGVLVIDGKDIVRVNSRMIAMVENREAEFDPIPLTEEWLLKFGFEKDNYMGSVSYLKDGGGFYLYCMVVGENKGKFFFERKLDDRDIEYVHQLQNLYFALTNTELKQKEG